MNITRVPCLAIVVACAAPQCVGRIVEVLHAAPYGEDFVFPDGVRGLNTERVPGWAVKYVGGSGPTMRQLTGLSTEHYAIYNDQQLRPLPGDEEREHQEQEAHA